MTIQPAYWERRAACRGADPELFFPITKRSDAGTAAKAICHRCPVISECLDWALSVGEAEGIWGGTDAEERRALRRARRARRVSVDARSA